MPEAANDARGEGGDTLVGTVLAKRYQVEELLGQGGMGAVYRGQHIHMRKTFAIKVLHKEMTANAEVVKRFEREAIAAGRIEHPNVAAATDFGQLEDGSFYLVLEYVPGKSLNHVLAARGALSVERTLLIARQIAAALAAAHAIGIVHRDLKPDNVMLIEKGGISEFVKVLDFGIAKVVSDLPSGDTALTRFGTIFGTPRYMSPEQAAGQEVDARADLYAIGLLIHEMLSGRPAFEAEEMVALLTKQMLEPPPELPAHVPGELRELVKHLLEKQPSDRPQTADEVVKRIDALAETYAPGIASVARVGRQSQAGFVPSFGARAPTSPSIVSAVTERARDVSERFIVPTARRALEFGKRRSIKRIPNWAFLAVGLVALVLVLSLRSEPKAPSGEPDKAGKSASNEKGAPATGDQDEEEKEEDDAEEESRTDGVALDPQLLRVLAEARRGSPSALFALEQRPPSNRSKHEWLALAQGRLKQRQVSEALDAFKKAMSMDASLAGDSRMMAGLRYFSQKEQYSDKVLEFAGEHMGAPGADLIFHVWSTTSRVTPYTQKAKDLLGVEDVRKVMSEPLRIAMELRDAKTCEDFKALLPRALTQADQRSLGPLKDLLKTEGCGGGLDEDCFPCLRDGPLLKDVITQAGMRRPPQFGRRRWR